MDEWKKRAIRIILTDETFFLIILIVEWKNGQTSQQTCESLE